MPNWCDNTVRLTFQDKEALDVLEKELSNKEGDGVFQLLRPNPAGEWQYDWSVENWGTKWDMSLIDFNREDDNTIWISFETAWSPPIALYEFLYEEGWNVEAYYHEPGMAFCGSWIEGHEEFYEYDISDLESLEAIPSDIEEFAGLIDYHNMLKEDGEFDAEED
jgi:hypothetical protein